MRIGVRVTSGQALGASVTDRGAKTVSHTNSTTEAGLADLLRRLTADAPARHPSVDSIAFDLDDVLTQRIATPEAEGTDGVLLVSISPRPARYRELQLHPDPFVSRHTKVAAHLRGGHSVTGDVLAPLDLDEAKKLAEELQAGAFGRIQDVAVVASGATANSSHEQDLAEVLLATVAGIRVSTSCDFGGVGLVDRMCSTVLNAVLTKHADVLVTRCEQATREVLGEVPVGFSRGDGGRFLPPRMRAFPVLGLRSSLSNVMAGASRLAQEPDCHVVMRAGGQWMHGEVINRLPVTSPEGPLTPQSLLSIPTPRLGVVTAQWADNQLAEPERRCVIARPRDDHGGTPNLGSRVDVREVDADEALLTGVAHCEPMAYIDELALAADVEEVRRAQQDLQHRALVMAITAGGRPGTERIVESSVMGVPYGGASTVRIQVRSVASLALGGSDG